MIATNAFKQAVVGTYTTSDTVIELNSISDTVGNADYLPNGGFNLILYDGLFGNPADANNAGSYEILACTEVNYATNEITVTRAQEDTTAVTIGAGSWQVVYGATKAFFEQFEDADATILKEADIVNDLTTGGVEAPLSAEQGKELKTQLDAKGKVLQVVSDTYSTEVTVATDTFTDTGLSATITPTSSTSNILVLISQPFITSRSENNSRMAIRLMRGSTEIYKPYTTGNISFGGFVNLTIPAVNFHGIASINHEDTTRTEGTTDITYKTQGRPQASDGSVTFQTGTAESSIILMEIEPNT